MERPKVRMTANSIHVRKEPKPNSEIIGLLKRDDVALLTGVSDDNYWYQVFNTKGLFGWISNKFAVNFNSNDFEINSINKLYPWIPIAYNEVWNQQESGNNYYLNAEKYLQSTNPREAIGQDIVNFGSSAFVNWCLEQAGYEGTDSAKSDSWIHWGRTVKEPCTGCIVLTKGFDFKQQLSWCRQVGFYLSHKDDYIEMIAFDKSGKVSTMLYPASDVVGFRLPYSY
jgi:uncharacterized protein (TIGR02594 family)